MAINKRDRKRMVRRGQRIRSRLIAGTNEKPRIAVYRSLKHIYAQIIDDSKGSTLASASSLSLDENSAKVTKTEIASLVGADLAKKARAHGIQAAVFDRGTSKYTGRISALADALRAGGIAI
jgi:large subunit ribosomal protein L18